MNIDEFVEAKLKDISRDSGIIKTTLSKYFNGRRNPSYTSLEAMAQKLNMKPEELLIGIRRRREKKEKIAKSDKNI